MNLQMDLIPRHIEKNVRESLDRSPVVALIGPRQCGKSTLAKFITGSFQKVMYLDLERPSDLLKLSNPEWFFSSQKDMLFCIDEIQRSPELFPLIRSLVDEWGQNGKFLVLGSASRDLLKQSSESLAGRISYLQLTPFLWSEIKAKISLEEYMVRGGFPRSILAKNEQNSFLWREDFIATFLERDLLQWKGVSSATMRRLWQMLAHNNGQTINYQQLGNSLGVSNVTIRNYIDLLVGTFMVDSIPPYVSNMGKRMVKSPKVYISDQGITNTLLSLSSFRHLHGHPVFGTSWEQLVLMNVRGHFPNAEIHFYRTAAGAETDFVIQIGKQTYAIECKSSQAPKLTKGFFNAIEDIQPEHSYVVAPVKQGWSHSSEISIITLDELIKALYHRIQ